MNKTQALQKNMMSLLSLISVFGRLRIWPGTNRELRAISPLENSPKPKPKKREYKGRNKILQASIFRGRAASPEWWRWRETVIHNYTESAEFGYCKKICEMSKLACSDTHREPFKVDPLRFWMVLNYVCRKNGQTLMRWDVSQGKMPSQRFIKKQKHAHQTHRVRNPISSLPSLQLQSSSPWCIYVLPYPP